MGFKKLEQTLSESMENIEEKSFTEILQEARAAMGLKLYKAAEFIGMRKKRLTDLEHGTFKSKPTPAEIIGLATMYRVSAILLTKKAEEFSKKFAKKKKKPKEKTEESKQTKKKNSKDYIKLTIEKIVNEEDLPFRTSKYPCKLVFRRYKPLYCEEQE